MTNRSKGQQRSLAELRDFFVLLVRRDLKTRYAGSVLGALWNLIHPITMILIYIAIFSSLIKGRMGENGTPLDYAVHICVGMLVWLVFQDTLLRSTTALTDNANFIQKIWFPPVLLNAALLFNVVLVYTGGLIVLFVLMGSLGYPIPPSAIGVWFVMLAAGVVGAGMGLVLSCVHVFFRDTAQVVTIAMQIGFWFNPIVYPKALLIDSPVGNWAPLLYLNPIEHFISGAQWLFGEPGADPWAYAWVVILVFPWVCLAIGLKLFRKMLPEVRDGL